MRRVRVVACVVGLLWIGAIPAVGGRGAKGPGVRPRHGQGDQDFAPPEETSPCWTSRPCYKGDPEFTKAMEEINADSCGPRSTSKNESDALKAEAAEVERCPPTARSEPGGNRSSFAVKADLQGPRQGLKDADRSASIEGLFQCLREDPAALWTSMRRPTS